MKKLLIGFSSIFAFLTVSCSTSTPNKVDAIVNKNENKLYKNKYINELLNLYFTDSKLKNSYINDQENISDSKFSELKYGLTFYPIFIHRSLERHNGRQHFEIIQKAKKSLEFTLKNDWYWTLDNIKQFKFVFNPYGDLYKEFNDDEKKFNEIDSSLGLTTNIQNNNIQKLIKISLKNSTEINKDITDIYSKKEAIYLVFDDNKILKLWKYENKSQNELQILTDMFIFKDSHNLEKQLENLEQLIFDKRKVEYERDLKIKNGKQDDIAKLNARSNDEHFMEFHATDQYNERLTEALTDINKDGWKIARYSMGGIYEQE
ncbi:aromatic motif membrane protein [Mycoplasma capricolum]|uniref:Lipoprotein, putative n=1 Tax=Mycoplasma capricolum subsp. capricolum (strain California kid / ATCC 27343 / NCTC 10154) TaxID=340047 RepID=Q2SR64_MYCCT|nr:aromatic motif membrane protein [Mycoplasma capricolum]ABC01840.1 lipoprotein, putative [Mycoplasma capricolum subsp. capricolum ATCC 27343]